MDQYLDLLFRIRKDGTHKPAARENMPGTTSLFGFQFRHDLSKGFPLLTTKKMFFKGVVIELLWFLRGDTNIKFLVENDVNIWNEDAYQYYLKRLKNWSNNAVPKSLDEFMERVKSNSSEPAFEDYNWGDCGFQYGKVWRRWRGEYNKTLEATRIVDQISNVIKSLQKNPESRRHIVTAIDPAHENDLALYWCHAMFQFNCRPLNTTQRIEALVDASTRAELYATSPDEIEAKLSLCNAPKYYLDCQLYQRSADVFLGVPFNIASYALLTELIAKICNMVPGDFIHTFGDVHIYDNHMDAVSQQLDRVTKPLPKIHVLERHKDHGTHPDHFEKYLVGRIQLEDFLMSLTRHDFRLEGYDPHDSIKAELSTGLKK